MAVDNYGIVNYQRLEAIEIPMVDFHSSGYFFIRELSSCFAEATIDNPLSYRLHRVVDKPFDINKKPREREYA